MDLLHWATLIEQGIAKLNHLDQGVETIGMDHHIIDQHQLNRVLTALRNAIAIYFYRRIYEHEAPRLQQKTSSSGMHYIVIKRKARQIPLKLLN